MKMVQPSFTAGEISPSLYGRIDFAKYEAGARTMRNFFCQPHGGAQNRPGTYFVGEVKDSSKRHRLIPFQFSTTQSYCLEFGNQTMRVVMDGARVLEGNKTITGATQAKPVVVTSVAHGYNNGDWVVISGVVGMTELNGKIFVVTNKTDDIFELYDVDGNMVDGTGYSAYVSGGIANRIYEISTPYSESALPDLRFAQSADVMYIVHPDYYPRKLSRTGHTSWTLEAAPFQDGPYKSRDPGDESISITPAARRGSGIALTSNLNVFVAAHVGTPFRLGYANPDDPLDVQWGYGEIAAVTDAKNAQIDIVIPFGFEFLFNVDFDAGLGGWMDYSTTDSTLTHDAVNSRAVFTKGAAGKSDMRQETVVALQEPCELTVDIESIQGSIRVGVGTTTGAADIMGWQTETTPGVKTYNFTPKQKTIFITIDNTGASAGNVAEFNRVSLSLSNFTTNDWRQAAWSSTNGYPRTVTFIEQRLTFGGTPAEPQTIWMSKSASYEKYGFSNPAVDDDSLNYTMAAQQVNPIRWLLPLGDLVAGTGGGEWRIRSASNYGAITPTSIDVKQQSYYGGAPLAAISVGDSIIFAQRGTLKIRDLRYSFEVDGYTGNDVSILANHLFKGYQIEEWAHAKNPESVIWAVRDDGVLLGFTYLREHEVYGWHWHDTDGEFESVCGIPGSSSDEVYFIVKRTINGVTRRYIEILMDRIADEDTYDYFFVDCGLSYSGPAVASLSGLDHLEGKTVVVLADGSVVNNKTVSNGQISLDIAASLIHIGLPYTCDLKTLNLEFYGERGTSMGKTKIIAKVDLHFEATRGAFVGSDESNLDEIIFSDEAYGDNPPPLFTGVKEISPEFGHGKEASVLIRQTDPLPITVLAVIPDVMVS